MKARPTMPDPTFTRHLGLILNDDDDNLLFRIVFVLGEERTLCYLARAAQIIQHGGLLTEQGLTWKELFCKIIKACGTANEIHAIFEHSLQIRQETEQ